jgi:hypothetical protein
MEDKKMYRDEFNQLCNDDGSFAITEDMEEMTDAEYNTMFPNGEKK